MLDTNILAVAGYGLLRLWRVACGFAALRVTGCCAFGALRVTCCCAFGALRAASPRYGLLRLWRVACGFAALRVIICLLQCLPGRHAIKN